MPQANPILSYGNLNAENLELKGHQWNYGLKPQVSNENGFWQYEVVLTSHPQI